MLQRTILSLGALVLAVSLGQTLSSRLPHLSSRDTQRNQANAMQPSSGTAGHSAHLAGNSVVLPSQRPAYLAGNSVVLPSQRPAYLAANTAAAFHPTQGGQGAGPYA